MRNHDSKLRHVQIIYLSVSAELLNGEIKHVLKNGRTKVSQSTYFLVVWVILKHKKGWNSDFIKQFEKVGFDQHLYKIRFSFPNSQRTA